MNDRRTLVWIGLSILLLLIAGVLIAYYFLPGFGFRGQAVEIAPLPGQISDNLYDEDLIVPGIWRRIGDRLYESISTGEAEVMLPVDRFTVTKTRRPTDTFRANEIYARDVLLYAQAIAEQGRRGEFLTLIDAFEEVFLRGSHPLTRVLIKDGAVSEIGGEDYALWFDYEKALLIAWQRWPEATIERSIQRGGIALKQLFTTDGLGKPTDLPDDVTYPWVSTDVQPTPAPPLTGEAIVIFSDIDLYVIRQLAAFDSDFAEFADIWTKTIHDSIASVGAPFPAYATFADGSGNIAVQEENFRVETKEVLQTLLHLAESGQDIETSLDFFRQRLLDGQGLSTAYRIADGAAVGTPAFADLYALAARIGRAADDTVLTEAALSELVRFYAGSQTSLIFGAYYRDGADSAFEMLLTDNVRALLALR